MNKQCNQILRALLGSDELVERWWLTKNRAFDYKTPQEVYATDPNAVKYYVFGQLSGW